MIFSKNQARPRRGFTLTEAAIVLGIVGLILGAIWVAAGAVYTNLRVNTTNRQMLAIAQAVRSLYSTQSTVETGVASTNAAQQIYVKAGVFPKDMLDNTLPDPNIRDSWGGQSAITASPDGGVAGAAFGVQFANVPQSACISLLVGNTGPGRDAGLTGVNIQTGDNAMFADAATFSIAAGAFPITATTAQTQCSDAIHNTVMFIFRLRG
jgi:type II secretory pathway pseudopilin PulG